MADSDRYQNLPLRPAANLPEPHTTMATSTSHPPFPSRPYTSGLGRAGGQSAFGNTPYNAQHTPYGAPPSAQNAGGYSAGPTQQQKEAQRLERERHERAERERREAEERGMLDALSDEQREEVNEAVSKELPADNR